MSAFYEYVNLKVILVFYILFTDRTMNFRFFFLNGAERGITGPIFHFYK